MIEPTDEMRRVYADAWLRAVAPKLEDAVVERMVAEEVAKPMPWRESALAAVLAIVERDYRVKAKPSWELPGRSCGDPHPGSPCWKRDWVGEPYLPCEIEARP